MHPVIKHLYARKNQSVPVKDGKKIVLVLFGGTMTGVRAAGAAIALSELKLSKAFDEVYTTSAGFGVASYLLSGQAKLGTSIYYENLFGRQFINPLRLWKVVNIDYVIKVMKELKVLDVGKILGSKTKLFSRVTNVKSKKIDYIEVHDFPASDYLKIMRASFSIPYLHPGSTEISGGKYMDVPLKYNQWSDHLKYVLGTDATDILVVYNTYQQFKYIQEKLPSLDKDRVFELHPPEDDPMKWHHTDTAKVKQAAIEMGHLTHLIFGEDKEISLNYEIGS